MGTKINCKRQILKKNWWFFSQFNSLSSYKWFKNGRCLDIKVRIEFSQFAFLRLTTVETFAKHSSSHYREFLNKKCVKYEIKLLLITILTSSTGNISLYRVLNLSPLNPSDGRSFNWLSFRSNSRRGFPTSSCKSDNDFNDLSFFCWQFTSNTCGLPSPPKTWHWNEKKNPHFFLFCNRFI